MGVFLLSLLVAPSVRATEDDLFPHPEYMDLLDQMIDSENEYGLTGTQLAVYKEGQLLKNTGYGYINNYYNETDASGQIILNDTKVLPETERTPVTTDTLFDLASNTKMYATVYALQKLISDQALIPASGEALTLETKISEIFPEFLDEANDNHWKEKITVNLLLSHYAGFAPDPQYHNETFDKVDGIPNGKNDLYSQDRDLTFEMIMKTPLTTEPGTAWAYSDVDMMLAGFIVEEISGQNLDTYVKENFYHPLKLNRLTFNPLTFGFSPDDIAATELHGNTRDGMATFNNIRTDIVYGQVHDEKAFYSMGGISGHAGLFGNAQQVAYLAQAMVNEGNLEGIHLFDQDVIDQFTAPMELDTQAHGGWRRKGATDDVARWFSKFAPAETIGHTGWTGTNTLIDPQNHLTLALMTNARNTPIMGPDANDFYTKNFTISSYGIVSEMVYRALGLAEDSLDTPEKVLEQLIESKLEATDLNEASASERNVIRALLHTLNRWSEHDPAAAQYEQTEQIQNTQASLKATEAADLSFLVVTQTLEQLLDKASNLSAADYTPASFEAVATARASAQTLLEGKEYTQTAIDEAAQQLEEKLAQLQPAVTEETNQAKEKAKEKLMELIKQAEKLLTEKNTYTKESLAHLQKVLEQAQQTSAHDGATIKAIEENTTYLEQAIKQLEKSKDSTPATTENDKKQTEQPTHSHKNLPKAGQVNTSSYLWMGILLIAEGYVLQRWFNKSSNA